MYIDIPDGDCGCTTVSDPEFLVLSMGIVEFDNSYKQFVYLVDII